MKLIFASLLSLLLSTANHLLAQYLVVGTYTNNNSTSKGIYLYSFDQQQGNPEQVSMVPTTNPSYQVVAKDQRTVYSVNETAAGKISAFAFDPASRQLTLLNTVESGGDDPCYLELDRTGKWLFCSNYSSGGFSIYAIRPNGALGALSQFIQHTGHGPDRSRQEGPHVHSTTISPDNRFLFVCDLGTDQITTYPFDPASGKVDTVNAANTNVEPGSGPRHIALSKNGRFLYNVTEMGGTISAYRLTNGKLQLLQTEDQLKAEKGKGAGADIHFSPNGKFLYVSQRSNSTIEIYKANRRTGKLRFKGVQSTNGNFPRNFTITPSGSWLLVANQKSDNIAIYKINKRTGLLKANGKEIKTGIPVSLKWISQ